MTHRQLLLAAFSFLAIASYGQKVLSENERKYLVYTVQPADKPSAAAGTADSLDAEKPQEKVDSMTIWFPNYSLCDWKRGMRFMVIPDKKDLVIKTFADPRGIMVSSASLLHKVMIYDGHDDANGGLHEHVNFICEETGDRYYYEVPTQSFDDYCYQKFGIPTLAYLDEVDSARVHLMGRKLITVADRYYVDNPSTTEGYTEIRDVPRDAEVEVVAVGVGTRSFPVKIVVKDEKGRQFFQYVTFSKTNSGLRDIEMENSDMIFHTFKNSFLMCDDNISVHPLYQKYSGKDVYTLVNMTLKDADSTNVRIPRLTPMKILKIRSQMGSDYAKVTLSDPKSGKTFTKEVLFKNRNRIGINDSERDMYVDNIFGLGNPHKMKGVREANITDLRNGVVRTGFTANEVLVAMGEPTSKGKAGANTVWIYRSQSGSFDKKVIFNAKTMRVVKVAQ